MTALTDKLLKVATAGSETFMAAPGKNIGATSFNINDATGWPTDTGFTVAIRVVDQSGNEVPNTYTEWLATLSGTTVSLGSSPSPVLGSDFDYPAGSSTEVYIPLSSFAHNRLIDALLAQHTQAGAHTGVTTDTIAASGNATVGGTLGVTGAASLSSTLAVTGAISGAGYSVATIKNPYKFSVYGANTQTVSAGVDTKCVLDTKEFDTSTNFDATTNYRFTAPVNGFYFFSGGAGNNGNGTFKAMIFKNGTAARTGTDGNPATNLSDGVATAFLQLTAGDYIELWVNSGTNTTITGGSVLRYFSGFLVSVT